MNDRFHTKLSERNATLHRPRERSFFGAVAA
jgi:hypothetical protein